MAVSAQPRGLARAGETSRWWSNVKVLLRWSGSSGPGPGRRWTGRARRLRGLSDGEARRRNQHDSGQQPLRQVYSHDEKRVDVGLSSTWSRWRWWERQPGLCFARIATTQVLAWNVAAGTWHYAPGRTFGSSWGCSTREKIVAEAKAGGGTQAFCPHKVTLSKTSRRYFMTLDNGDRSDPWTHLS